MNYDTTPPALNLKCIVFTIVLASSYWFLPPRNKYVLVALSYFPYLALAWYDWIYSCKHNFGPTYLANYYSWAKPQNSRQIVAYKNWAPAIKSRVRLVDIALSIIILSLLPKFIRWNPKPMTENQEKKAREQAIVFLLFVIGVFVYLRIYKN